MALLEIDGLSKQYNGVLAVDGVSLDVQAGEILGLIGANGAGKTTLFNLVSGFTPATSGRVQIGGEDVTNYPAYRRARCGMARTFQTPQLFGRETVRDNVLSGVVSDRLRRWSWRGRRSSRSGRPLEDGERILETFGLAAVAEARASSLPYGAQRRLEMARAMMTSPRILMLDEPAAGMLPSEMAELNRLIAGIRDQGCTVVLVEHNMAVVMNVCDRIAVLEFGRLIASGTPAEIRSDAAVKRAYFGEAGRC